MATAFQAPLCTMEECGTQAGENRPQCCHVGHNRHAGLRTVHASFHSMSVQPLACSGAVKCKLQWQPSTIIGHHQFNDMQLLFHNYGTGLNYSPVPVVGRNNICSSGHTAIQFLVHGSHPAHNTPLCGTHTCQMHKATHRHQRQGLRHHAHHATHDAITTLICKTRW